MTWETPGRKVRFSGPIVILRVGIWKWESEFPMFAKVKWSQNMFLSIRNMFCSHPAYPKPNFLYTSKSKLIKNRISQNFDRKSPKMLVITAVLMNCPHRSQSWPPPIVAPREHPPLLPPQEPELPDTPSILAPRVNPREGWAGDKFAGNSGQKQR